MHKHSEHTLAQ